MAGRDPRDVLLLNQQAAVAIANRAGTKQMRAVLEEAEADLIRRLARIRPGAEGGFEETQMRATLAQIRQTLAEVTEGIRDSVMTGARRATELAVEDTAEYLRAADRQFRGVGVQPLALDEGAMLSRAVKGTNSTLLRRLGSSEEKKDRKARVGILERYGLNTVERFEDKLRMGMITRKPWDEMRSDLIAESPFLQGQPGHWAERIVRTEVMGAHGKASLESFQQVAEEFDDMCKILAATFDVKTASDSYAVHGQVRRTDEPFESWFGEYDHPPNRPNDREVVVPHRTGWAWPKYLTPKSNAAVAARWKQEGRKGSPPPRPRMTTVEIKGVHFPR